MKPKRTLTPMQEIEVWSWYCAKRELGSVKNLAQRMGVSEHALRNLIKCKRLRQIELRG